MAFTYGGQYGALPFGPTQRGANAYNQAGLGLAGQLGGAGVDAYGMGLQNLMKLLQSGGRTDPTLFNMQLSDLGRSVQGAQDTTEGVLAGTGMSGSGVGRAIQAAQGQAGVAERRKAIAENDAGASDRMMQILQLLGPLVLGPGADFAGIGTGMAAAGQARSDRNRAAMMAAISGILGAGGQAASGG